MKTVEHDRHVTLTVILLAVLLAAGAAITLADMFEVFSIYDLR